MFIKFVHEITGYEWRLIQIKTQIFRRSLFSNTGVWNDTETVSDYGNNKHVLFSNENVLNIWFKFIFGWRVAKFEWTVLNLG